MTKPAAKTGSGPTFMVAVEQFFPQDVRLLHDTMAAAVLPPSLRIFLWTMRFPWVRNWMVRASEKSAPGIWCGILCRKRYIDEKLTAAARGPIQSVVNLGAGFDTRIYRLPGVAHLPAWEVDQSENILAKRRQLRAVYGEVPGRVILVPMDFDRERLASVLAAHGYTGDVPTFFVWEAVSQYVGEDGIRMTLDFLARAPIQSQMAFTYVCKDFIQGTNLYGQKRLYQDLVVEQKLWRFGIDPDQVASLLAEYGWHVREHLGYDELAQRYAAKTRPALGPEPASMLLERMVWAERG